MANDGVIIRAATEADLPAVVGIYVRAYAQPPWNEQNAPGPSETYLRWMIGSQGASCLVAANAIVGQVLGFVFAGPRPYAHFLEDWERMADRPPEGWPRVSGRLGYIWEIAVEPGRQRQGLGTALLAAAIERLRSLGVETVVLRSSERAPAAIALYRRFGFQRLPLRERRDPQAGPWALALT
jgi:ribosomal protein S18 acetylase RimI-like enzyme